MAESSEEKKKIVPVPADMIGKTATGTVTTVIKNRKYHFGFISLATDEKADDPNTPAIYYNPSGLKDKVYLRKGYVVRFTCANGEDGRAVAQDITLVKPTLEEIEEQKAARAAEKAAQSAAPVKSEPQAAEGEKKQNSRNKKSAKAETTEVPAVVEKKPTAEKKTAAKAASAPAPAEKADSGEDAEKRPRNPLLPESYVGKTGLIGTISTLYRKFRYGFIALGTGEDAKREDAYVVHFRLNKVPKDVSLDRDFVVSFSVAKESNGRTYATDIKLTPEGEEQKRKRDALREQARDQQERIHLLEEKEESTKKPVAKPAEADKPATKKENGKGRPQRRRRPSGEK